jgi:hypothetical protein
VLTCPKFLSGWAGQFPLNKLELLLTPNVRVRVRVSVRVRARVWIRIMVKLKREGEKVKGS